MNAELEQIEGACEDASVAVEDPLLRLWYVRLPRVAATYTTSLADALAEGSWLAAWPRVGMFLPPAALAVGLLAPALWPGIENVYSESLPFLMLAAALAILSPTAGMFLLAGYAIGDALHAPSLRLARGVDPLPLAGSRLMADLLLSVLLFWVPYNARRLGDGLSSAIGGAARSADVRAVGYVAASGLLAYIWAQATIVLIRPVFTWLESTPTIPAVEQVQTRWTWLVAAVLLAATARVLLERMVVPVAPGAAMAEQLRRSSVSGRPLPLARRIPPLGRVAVQAAVITFLLSGAYESMVDGLLVAALTASLSAWRLGLVGKLAVPWATAIERVPAIARFAAIALVGYLLSSVLLGVRWGNWGSGLRPVLVGALLTLVLYYAAFPPAARIRKGVGS